MSGFTELRRRWRAIRGDIRDLVAQGGMVVKTPAAHEPYQIAMTVVQPDGDVIARFHRDAPVGVIDAHNREVKNRLHDVHKTIDFCLNGSMGIFAIASILLIAMGAGIENFIIRYVTAALGGIAAGGIGRILAGRAMSAIARHLFTGFLNGGT